MMDGGRFRRRRLAAAGFLAVASQVVAGCAAVGRNAEENWRAYNANTVAIDPVDVKAYVRNQESIMSALERLAPPTKAGTTKNWRTTVEAGIGYVDVRCRGYIQAIFWLNRTKNAASKQTQLFGATAAAALEVLNASSELVALTPLGFALVDNTINNLGDSLLFSLPPEAVSQLLESQQQVYVAGLAKSYTTRVSALRAIQGYAELCLSSNIEAAAVDAVANRRFTTQPPAAPAVPAKGGTTPPPDSIPVVRPDS